MGLFENPQKVLVSPFNYYDYFNECFYYLYSRISCCTTDIYHFLRNMKKEFKIIRINIALLILFIGISDIVLSNVILRRSFINPKISKYGIPRQTCSTLTKYDVSNLYNESKKISITYSRDNLCYRSFEQKLNKDIVLTIGGSTTDQRFVSESNTFQDQLDDSFGKKYDFINGGVDGQSSVGHLISIENWHSKALPTDKVKHIVFYLGVNDQNIPGSTQNINSKRYSISRKIRDFLANNSYLYIQIKNIIFSNKLPRGINILAVHGPPFKPVKNPKREFVNIENLDIENYQVIIKSLINSSRKYFPNATLHFVQQQVPGCYFISRNEYLNRFPEDYKHICKSIGQVYLSMDKAIEKIQDKSFINVYPMYLSKAISDDGIYDFIHSNKKGSKEIASYLSKNLKIDQ